MDKYFWNFIQLFAARLNCIINSSLIDWFNKFYYGILLKLIKNVLQKGQRLQIIQSSRFVADIYGLILNFIWQATKIMKQAAAAAQKLNFNCFTLYVFLLFLCVEVVKLELPIKLNWFMIASNYCQLLFLLLSFLIAGN